MLSAGILSHWFMADAVWYAFPMTQILMYIYYFFVVLILSKRIKISGRGIFDKVLLLPDSFYVPKEDCMDVSITSMVQVTNLTREVWKFCNTHGCDSYRRYYMSLAVEEMVGNIIEYGFKNDKKRNHSIDVRILKKGR
ncbi:MAG: ATP-binding protein [Lachnospiraceae bacterium]|nr:ATP-binding protein [Lachnospiraceae bacterium]